MGDCCSSLALCEADKLEKPLSFAEYVEVDASPFPTRPKAASAGFPRGATPEQLLELLRQTLKARQLQMKDLPEPKSSEFTQLLQELGFESALDRVKLGKMVTRERTGEAANVANAESSANVSFDTLEYEEMSRLQKAEAKYLIKDFVKCMIQGRYLQTVKAGSGEIVDCLATLNKKVDRLVLACGQAASEVRLAEISEVTVSSEGVSVLGLGGEIPLLLPEEERETFANALAILAHRAARTEKLQ
ncbi:unnamed protein product [Effrenium voratum]|uniref:Uncharacterized protein n=1 Tax=Effrenium voratum TaxID=2562239 RepID=A0AA36IXT6_9DINO|nr:unnamed protein product [Effrenium voratum]